MSDPTVTGVPEPEPDGPGATVAAGAGAATDGAPAAPPGYDLHTLIGSGGMGAVYRAHDLSLTRDVAVKFLHARFAPESVAAWRFTEEARITARLQHPGIPPIHQVGRTPDGRPFLAMKLIKGDTLESLLKARNAPAEERGRFVGIFEQVAQAVAFAHSRRIIHRDLKPANVMVGGFGEVQVMDWGLAKELGTAPSTEAGRSDATLSVELRLGRDRADATQAGSLLGTPAYMPPEQAVGAIDQIDERADVFGLGAILCVVLTGQPPFIAETAEAARVLAARGKLDDAFARLDACGAEPELIALAKRCLSPEAADRPANAGAVARAVATFRADVERRVRQAETDRATAEVRVAEERKRRRVQWALTLTVFGLLAVVSAAWWWIDGERSKRRGEQEAEQLRQVAEAHARVADLKARQLVTERDVTAALNESQTLRETGWKQTDDTHRWGLTLAAARSSVKRAEGLLAAGEPTEELHARVRAAAAELDRDDRDRTLIAEIDRIGEENELRFLIPISLSRRPSERYAAAFRARGIDLLTVPLDEAVGWLNAHRFRPRLTAAVRNWQLTLPTPELDFLATQPHRPQSDGAIAALAGEAGAAAVRHRPSARGRLAAVLSAVTDDPFAREWWAAVEKRDDETLLKLLKRPEWRRMSSRELSSLADGLATGLPDFGAGNERVLTDFLQTAYERFPSEYWVNFRLATAVSLNRIVRKGDKDDETKMIRHLTAAVAARPSSVIARVALGAALLEHQKDDPTGLRMIRAAAELDPTSPWPPFLLSVLAMERENFTDALNALERTVRADPDLGFLLIYPLLTYIPFSENPREKFPPRTELAALIDRLINAQPDHPGGYTVRAEFRLKSNDARGALADFRKAKSFARTDYTAAALSDTQIALLEPLARWEEKLPAVLRGETKPTAEEFTELAGYCAKFEHNYILATRFAGAALDADPMLFEHPHQVTEFAGWAVRAGRAKATGPDGPTARRPMSARGCASRHSPGYKSRSPTHPNHSARYLRTSPARTRTSLSFGPPWCWTGCHPTSAPGGKSCGPPSNPTTRSKSPRHPAPECPNRNRPAQHGTDGSPAPARNKLKP